MKRMISALLALILMLSLAACGDSGAETQSGSAQMQEPQESQMIQGIPKVQEIQEVQDMQITDSGRMEPTALAAPLYPEMAPYPNESDYIGPDGRLSEAFNASYDAWWADVRAQREQPEGYAEGMRGFLQNSIHAFLGGAYGENRVYSPLNVYLALAMLCELTDGQSRAQLLSLLGAEQVETVREQARALWNANYRDDGVVKSVLASSVWLNETVGFIQSTLDTLAEDYYASSFQGRMGTPEYDRMLQTWLNEQTGGLLSEQADGITMDAQTLMTLAATICFKAPWTSKFSLNATEKDVFYAPEEILTVDYMHKSGARSYYWGKSFSAVSLELESDGAMWLLLPEEGVSPEDLLQDTQAMDFLLSRDRYGWENRKHLTVNIAVPRFDIVSDTDLIPGLQALGVRDIFDYTVSDFSPLTTDTDEVCVSQAKHAARVKIDEEGCEAAAYTVVTMRVGAAMPPEEELDFTLNRPFIFCITGAQGLPLFVGVVNTPVS